MRTRIYGLIGVLAAFALITGCGLETSGLGTNKRSYIDGPADGSVSEVNHPVAITTHANFRVTEIGLSIDQDPREYDVPQGRMRQAVTPLSPGLYDLYEARFTWTPTVPGRYRIYAYSLTGSSVHGGDNSFTIHVTITEATPELSPPPFIPPTPTRAAAPTSAPPPSPTTAALPRLRLSADALSLTAGQCTYLRWTSESVESLRLDGEAVAFTGSRQVCPRVNQTYVLSGSSGAGSADTSVTLTVQAPPPVQPLPVQPVQPQPVEPQPVQPQPELDSTPPNITDLAQSAAEVFDSPSCGAVTNTITARVRDSGGVARVELFYRVTSGKKGGVWRSVAMARTGANRYTATLDSGALSASLANYVPGQVEVMVKAWDEANNLAESGSLTFATKYCLL